MTSVTDNDPAKSTTPPLVDQDPLLNSNASQPAGDPLRRSLSRAPSAETLPSSTLVRSPSGLEGSLYSPGGSKVPTRVSSPYSTLPQDGPTTLISHAFAPHVSVLPSLDCEELMRHKGLDGGLLELLRPFGETIPARVVIRDSTGAGRAWDDFGIRFVGVKDGLDPPRLGRTKEGSADDLRRASLSNEYRPARLRTGGDASQIEQLVERWLDSQTPDSNKPEVEADLPVDCSAFNFYERRLLSGTILTPHETFAHPVALVIAISSRNPAPIEELRNLYAESNTGASRLPPWVNNEYLRYYVLVHDEDYDDIKKSTTLFEQMKRHFGLHCHLLRIRSTPCPADSSEATTLPRKTWTSAAEDLAEFADRDENEGIDTLPLRIYESDATAIKSFVREMVTQSIVPSMERSVATWNDQVASRRRGISGRFMSLSKRFTPFGSRSNSPATTSGSNYDSSGGFYRTDAPEALMRKLADYAMMLRDYKLAHSTYELLCGDFKSDKAWRHYAGANEMAALTLLLTNPKPRLETLDTWLENAYYSYLARCNAPFYATRTIILSASFLLHRQGPALDDAARWLIRLLDDRVVGPVAHALLLEKVGDCFAARQGQGTLCFGARQRKAAFWTALAARAWLDLDKMAPAGECLSRAVRLYGVAEEDDGEAWTAPRTYLADMEAAVQGGNTEVLVEEKVQVQVLQTPETVDQRPHRASVSSGTTFDPLGAIPLPTSPLERRDDTAADGFE